MSATPPAVSSRLWLRTALTSLVALMAVSAGLVVTAPVAVVGGLPPGWALAVVKVAALAFVFKRVWRRNVYSMQWSSMFILLFVAEGTVRAVSDPPPSALLGIAEAVAATAYFVAVLVILRPLKQQAKRSAAEPS